ncbi:uncharacterized protein TrAFT101_009040 [Trichoderma asperellum]|uniref:uncharacterized protein n=1 Tax=Trichoderma asperellum TaxID=101201 RepID=UPI003330AC4C|nr:hypothetical protein TrAFT101_009040 [Trichoderma asperellum]
MDGFGCFLCKSPDGSWNGSIGGAGTTGADRGRATGQAPRHVILPAAQQWIPDIGFQQLLCLAAHRSTVLALPRLTGCLSRNGDTRRNAIRNASHMSPRQA